ARHADRPPALRGLVAPAEPVILYRDASWRESTNAGGRTIGSAAPRSLPVAQVGVTVEGRGGLGNESFGDEQLEVALDARTVEAGVATERLRLFDHERVVAGDDPLVQVELV